VEADRIFIADGQIWTSAGMTAGLDLALGLVERDIGREKGPRGPPGCSSCIIVERADSRNTLRFWIWTPVQIGYRLRFQFCPT